MSLTIAPNEIKLQILTNLDHKDLCRVQSLSREWNIISSDDRLWRDLFIAKYPKISIPFPEQAQKEFKERTLAIPIKMWNLRSIITSFLCNLKRNEKRELICLFPNEHYYALKVAQGFGPERGTEKGFEGPADEIEYYQFDYHPMSPDKTADKPINSKRFIQCPGENVHHDSSFQQAAIPLAQSYACSARDQQGIWNPKEVWVDLSGAQNCVNGKIEGVDVGFGNTLGYFSEINDWKFPFKLFCISDPTSGKSAWVGLLPSWEAFKFVSIDSNGSVTWEKKNGNRSLSPHPRYDANGHQALMSDLREHPIKFS